MLDASAQIICDRRAWPDGRRCGQASVPGPSLREGLRIWSVAEPVWARAPGSVRSAPPEAHATTAPNGRGVATCTGRDPRSSRPGAWSPRHPLTCLLCSFWPATAWRGCRREAQPVAHPLAAAGRALHDDQHVHAVASARSTGRPARCHSGKRFSSPGTTGSGVPASSEPARSRSTTSRRDRPGRTRSSRHQGDTGICDGS